MAVEIRKHGHYTLYRTSRNHRILDLDDAANSYAWVHGQRGDLLVRSKREHRLSEVLQRGQYWYVDFRDDPRFRDVPHLFLQKGRRYQEYVLPNGLPADNDVQKLIIDTGHTLDKRFLDDYLAEYGYERAEPTPARKRTTQRTARTSRTRAPRTRAPRARKRRQRRLVNR